MISTRNRILLLFHTLINADKTLSCKALAQVAKISERTVKNDLIDLKSFAKASGCVIHSKKGKGYWFEILDSKTYSIVKEQLDIRFSNIADVRNTVSVRSNVISRILIVKEDYVKLDDVADQVFLSRSSIKSELKELRLFFQSFNIVLDTKPHKGIKVIGREISKRLCMIELYEIHYHKTISLLGKNDFTEYFDVDQEEHNHIRKIFLDTLRQSNHSLLDSFANRVVNYLILMRNRIARSHPMEISQENRGMLQEFDEYRLAGEIVKNLQVLDGFVIENDEIIAIELLLLIWMDLTVLDDLPERYGIFYERSKKLAIKILRQIDHDWQLDLTSNEQIEEFVTCLIPILLQVSFSCSQYLVSGAQVEDCSIKNSPLSLILAKSAARMIECEYGCQITDHDINMIAIRFYAMVDRVDYEYQPRKVIVCSRTGKSGAQIIKDKILKRYPIALFKQLDVFEFYEVRALEDAGYDYVICNFGAYSYHYRIPFFQIEQIPTVQQMENLYDQIILGGYDLKKIMNRCHFEEGHGYRAFEYESKQSFLNLLSYKHGKNTQAILEMQDSLSEYGDAFIKNDVLVLVSNGSLTKEHCFEIYQLSRIGIWEKKMIKTIVFVSIHFDYDHQILRLVEQATSLIVSNPSVIEKLLNNQLLAKLCDEMTLNLRAG